MLVQAYLHEHGLEALKEELHIVAKEYPEGLVVLNYNQLDSPKMNPIVQECRGLILEKDTWEVVSRSFDRFFNYGEADTDKHLDMSKCTVSDKVDGSIIKIYNYKQVWYVSTRGTAFAESEVNGWGVTFEELVFRAMGVDTREQFQKLCDTWFNTDITYIFELTSVENRVVTFYEGTSLWMLALRTTFDDFQTAPHWRLSKEFKEILTGEMRIKFPQYYTFDSIEECIEMSKNLPNLEEGYVVYQNNVPFCKIKSPGYVAVHHIRGDGLTPKSIARLVLINEHEEYLTYFDTDRHFFVPYVEALEKALVEIQAIWETVKDIETQKDFALAIKDCTFSAALFWARKNKINVVDSFHMQKDNWKMEWLLKEVKA